MRHYWIVKNLQVVRVRVITVHRNGRFIVGPIFPVDAPSHGEAFPWPKLGLLERRAAFLVLARQLTDQLADLHTLIADRQELYIDLSKQRDLAINRAKRDQQRDAYL